MDTIKKTQLFNASCVALVLTALVFATRGSFVEAWAAAQLTGRAITLRFVAFVPAVLIVFFSFLHVWKRKHV